MPNGADPEKPAPRDVGSDSTSHNGTNEEAKEICPTVQKRLNSFIIRYLERWIYSQIETHPHTTLVKEHHIVDYNRHDTLICCSSKSADDAGTNEASIGSCKSLPNICPHTNQTTDQNRGTPAKKIARGNNDEVCVTQSNWGSYISK